MNKLSINIKGTTLNRHIISLITSGCEHARKTGGCFMCGFFNPADKNMTDDNIIEQFNNQLYISDLDDIQAIDIFVGGSFLNDNEISKHVRQTLLEKISEIKSIKRVFFSSRPEYITIDKLKECCKWIGNKTIEVGLGLETTDDYVRNTILRKNYMKEDFISASRNIKEAGCELLVYLLVKPPFLSEAQAIEDTVKSALYVFDIAEKNDINVRVSLEPVHICPGTELEKLFIKKEYKLINLWSVIEILRRIHQRGTVYVGIGKDDVGLSHDKIPYSCEKCFTTLVNEIHEFNKTQSFSILDSLYCECKI